MNLYEKILSSLNDKKVEYLVVGGIAVNLYGVDRTTKDLDIWINTAEENLIKLKQSFHSLQFSEEGILEALKRLRNGETISVPDDNNFLKIDFMGLYSSHLLFNDAYGSCTWFDIGGMKVSVLSKKNLIDTKIRAGRNKDLSDAAGLQNTD